MKKRNMIWLGIIAVLVVIQFIPSGRPETIADNAGDLLANNAVPDSVAQLLRSACYDCHSNATNYPWYAYVAPVSWLVSRDINEGRAKFNFSDWETYNKMDKAKILGEMSEEVESGEMPMPIYVVMHPEAKLSNADRERLMLWTDLYGESLFE